MRLRISEKVVGSKLDKFGGGTIGKRKGSGESDGENLERMRSILSLKNWRNELASDCVSGVSGDELDGLRWRIEFKVYIQDTITVVQSAVHRSKNQKSYGISRQ